MVSEAQKRALKKWKEKNLDKLNEYNKRWREDNEEYRIKQIGYTIKYQKRKKAFLEECRRLCGILL
jgi:restriction endonuclease S subunit